MIRSGQMDMITYMRSNDVFLGLPHDIFAFTMIQEIMARTLSVEQELTNMSLEVFISTIATGMRLSNSSMKAGSRRRCQCLQCPRAIRGLPSSCFLSRRPLYARVSGQIREAGGVGLVLGGLGPLTSSVSML